MTKSSRNDPVIGGVLLLGFMAALIAALMTVNVIQARSNGKGLGVHDTRTLEMDRARSFYVDGPRVDQCCPSNRHP